VPVTVGDSPFRFSLINPEREYSMNTWATRAPALFFLLCLLSSPGIAAKNGAGPGGHLRITEVFVLQGDPDTILIGGEDFDFGGGALVVTIGGIGELVIVSETATDIEVEIPELPAGDYLLSVFRQGGQSQGDEYDLTIVPVEIPTVQVAFCGVTTSVFNGAEATSSAADEACKTVCGDQLATAEQDWEVIFYGNAPASTVPNGYPNADGAIIWTNDHPANAANYVFSAAIRTGNCEDWTTSSNTRQALTAEFRVTPAEVRSLGGARLCNAQLQVACSSPVAD
jgi:hypothetical protein